jgi:hypothetical protein
MKPIQSAFVVPNHQPMGNFDLVFQEAFERSYRPFVEVLRRHPVYGNLLEAEADLDALEELPSRLPNPLARSRCHPRQVSILE